MKRLSAPAERAVLIISAVILSGCGAGTSAAPVATPNAADCKAAFVATITGALEEARTEEDFKKSMDALKPDSFPSCAGISAAQKTAIRYQAITELTPIMLAKAADWA